MEAPSSVCSSIIIVNGAEGGEEEEEEGISGVQSQERLGGARK